MLKSTMETTATLGYSPSYNLQHTYHWSLLGHVEDHGSASCGLLHWGKIKRLKPYIQITVGVILY